jgi:hypothetical protein
MLQGNVISIKTAKVNKEVTLRKKEVFNGERSSQVERRGHEQKCYNCHQIGNYSWNQSRAQPVKCCVAISNIIV